MRKQNKRELSRASLGGDDDLLAQQQKAAQAQPAKADFTRAADDHHMPLHSDHDDSPTILLGRPTMDGSPIRLWNEWAIQILVLFSFALQVVLLLLAGIRRREAFPGLRLLLWLAYQLADSTAIYALGILSLTSTTSRDHELVAFWVPFLLLHLGGPDNITAYALEDNQLWKRHLLTVTVQVLGATYVLYQHVAASGSLILVATMLMFAIGVVKYAERTWALKRGNMDDIRSSLNNSGIKDDRNINPKGVRGRFDQQVLLEVAHSQFHFCKLRLVDSSVNMDRPRLRDYNFGWNDMWKLMEMELSLIYDILYTKAAVTHTWIGYLVRFAAPPAIAAAFVLFHLHLMMTSGVTDHRRVDVAITYVLLAGAFFMEATALLAAVGSTWTLAFLSNLPMRWSSIQHALVCSGRWHRLRRLLLSLGRLDIRRRRWSGTIGQYNLLHLCTRDSGGHLVGRLAEMLGMEERWNRFHYSASIVLPEDLKELLFRRYSEQMSDRNHVNALGLLRLKWGDLAVKRHDILGEIRLTVGGAELQEDIVTWHIATNIYLANRVDRDGDYTTARNIQVLSNYMMFLLVQRPYLLPGLVLHRMYNITCVNLDKIWSDEHENSRLPSGAENILKKLFRLRDDPVISSTTRVEQRNKLAEILHKLIQKKYKVRAHNLEDTTKEEDSFFLSAYRVQYGAHIAYTLLNQDKEEAWTSSKSLEVILDVWLDFLFYVSNRCSRESYAKKLNSGVELTAILWLMGTHIQPILHSS